MSAQESRDVLAVNLTSQRVHILATDKTMENAEAFVMIAVARRGLDTDFFVAVPHGEYKDGDTWPKAK